MFGGGKCVYSKELCVCVRVLINNQLQCGGAPRHGTHPAQCVKRVYCKDKKPTTVAERWGAQALPNPLTYTIMVDTL